ncbi:hypothetical protein FRC17_005695, partial [Serendipita sp. 399]
MPPPNATAAYHLIPYPRTLLLYQFRPDAPIPLSLLRPLTESSSSGFKSITWTRDEISIVTDVPIEEEEGEELNRNSNSDTEDGEPKGGPEEYAALAIRGPMDL